MELSDTLAKVKYTINIPYIIFVGFDRGSAKNIISMIGMEM